MSDNEPNYTKPTSQLDLGARQQADYQPSSILVKGTDPEPSENGFVGVDPIYQNFASETEKPFAAEDGPEKKVEESRYADDADFDAGATPEGVGESEEVVEEPATTPTKTTTPSTPPAPTS